VACKHNLLPASHSFFYLRRLETNNTLELVFHVDRYVLSVILHFPTLISFPNNTVVNRISNYFPIEELN
jgi:hypothetical protein